MIATFGLAAGLVAFIRFGAGPFSPVAFALPYFLSTIPAIAVVAALRGALRRHAGACAAEAAS